MVTVPAEIHALDIGTIFEETLTDENGAAVDISSAATVKNFFFQKPDASVVTKTASFSGTGVDGKMRYTTVANDLDQAGSWKVQGYVELSSGKWRSSIKTFLVHSNLA